MAWWLCSYPLYLYKSFKVTKQFKYQIPFPPHCHLRRRYIEKSISKMTNSTTQITTTQQQQLVESSSSSSSSASESSKNPFIPFFPNFNFNFQLPHFFNLPAKKHQHDDDGGDKNKATTIIPKLQEGPNVVTFPKTQLAVVSEQPLQAESQISSTKTSNPLILYQVYFTSFFCEFEIVG